MYVCICRAITDRQVREAIADGAITMRELRQQLGVCTCCGRCKQCVRDLLSDEMAPLPGFGEPGPAGAQVFRPA